MTDLDGPRLPPPPVDDLSELSWHRVEKRLFAQLDLDGVAPAPARAPGRAWRPWALAGGLAIAATALALVVLRPDAAPAPPAADVRGAEPTRVVTQETPSTLDFAEASLVVEPASAITLHGDAHRGVLVVIERGGAAFAVAPRGSRPPFVVQAGDVTVRVVGTRFQVLRSGDAARVDVTEGSVEVVARGHRVQVRAGESWSSGGVWEAAARGAATTTSDVAVAPFLVDPPPGDGVADDGLPWEGQSSAGAAEVSGPRSRQRSTASAAPPGPSAQERFERATALEARDPRGALAEYRALARTRGPWAANALYAAGRLAAELGDRDGAAKLLREYLERYPRGANARDARALLGAL